MPPRAGHWGPHFPDAARRTITKAGVSATLALGDPVTHSGALELVILRARAAPGNGIQVESVDDGESDTGLVVENTLLGQVSIRWWGGVTTAGDLVATINANSTLIEAVGPFNPSDILINIEDEFAFLDLEHGTAPLSGPLATYWGPHFPDGGDADDPPLVTPDPPDGVATFALQLENGLSVTYAWATSIDCKTYDGKEYRAATLDDPKLSIDGSAMLFGAEALLTRLKIARHAAAGAAFLFGLPYEETTLTADASGAVLSVASTTSLDWAVLGQRVLLIQGDDSAEGTIQGVTGTTVTLDAAPSVSVSVEGARLMPAIPVLLEPQQTFARYRSAGGADRWALRARAAGFGFPASPTPGELPLVDLVATSALAGLTLRARTAGIDVSVSFEAADPGVLSGVELGVSPDDDGNLTIAIRAASGATAGEFFAAVNPILLVLGDYDPDAVINAADDFALTPFAGASDGGPGDMGRGATLTAFADRPIWDRRLMNSSTLGDRVHSMSEIVDLGATPFEVPTAAQPDWGRALMHQGDRDEWQWLKLMLGTIKGQWKTFWLPTWRADLAVVGNATTTTITVSATTGDYELWRSRGYAMLQVQQNAGISYVLVTASLDNGDGTITLTVEPDSGQPTPVAAAVTLLSWLELAHLEKDEVTVTFDASGFSCATQARVVQQ